MIATTVPFSENDVSVSEKGLIFSTLDCILDKDNYGS